MTNSPCKDCGKRGTRCHVDCAEYNAWQKEHEQVRESAYKVRVANAVINEYGMSNVAKYKKKLRD